MHTRTALITVALLLAALTACSSSNNDGPKPAAASPADAPAKATPSPAPAKPLAFGTSQKWTNTGNQAAATGTTTVLSYTQPATVDFPADTLGVAHPVWVIIEVKVCNTKGASITVSQEPWALTFPDDTRTPAPILGGAGLPTGTIPAEGAPVAADHCLRGKVPFAIEKGQRPERIIYGPHGSEPTEWTVPAA